MKGLLFDTQEMLRVKGRLEEMKDRLKKISTNDIERLNSIASSIKSEEITPNLKEYSTKYQYVCNGLIEEMGALATYLDEKIGNVNVTEERAGIGLSKVGSVLDSIDTGKGSGN